MRRCVRGSRAVLWQVADLPLFSSQEQGDKFKAVSIDLWTQLHEFCEAVEPDLSGWSEDDACWSRLVSASSRCVLTRFFHRAFCYRLVCRVEEGEGRRVLAPPPSCRLSFPPLHVSFALSSRMFSSPASLLLATTFALSLAMQRLVLVVLSVSRPRQALGTVPGRRDRCSIADQRFPPADSFSGSSPHNAVSCRRNATQHNCVERDARCTRTRTDSDDLAFFSPTTERGTVSASSAHPCRGPRRDRGPACLVHTRRGRVRPAVAARCTGRRLRREGRDGLDDGQGEQGSRPVSGWCGGGGGEWRGRDN